MTISPEGVPTTDPVVSTRIDALSFEDFFRTNYARTVRLAHLLTGTDSVSQDLAQEAFGRVFGRFGELREPASYLRAATVNICRNWHRSQRRELDRLRRHGPTGSLALGEPDVLADVLVSLPYRQRAVLVLRYWLDLSEGEIAITLGCRPGTVKSLHSRALDALRKDVS